MKKRSCSICNGPIDDDVDALIESFTKHVDFDFSHVVENALKMARFNLTIDQRDRQLARCRYCKIDFSFRKSPMKKSRAH